MRDKLALLAMHRIDLGAGAVLERDCVYIVPLVEASPCAGAPAPPPTRRARRVSPRHHRPRTAFDRVRDGYKGPLYAEIAPRAFSILVRPGSRLVQLRIRRGTPQFSDTALRRLNEAVGLVEPPEEGTPARDPIRNGLAVTVDVAGDKADGIVGWRARRHTDLIDVDRIGHYDPLDYFEPVRARRGEGIVLDPNDFHILASREAVVVPPDHAAEMLPYDTFVGEFRVHFAGFSTPASAPPRRRAAAAAPSSRCARTRCCS